MSLVARATDGAILCIGTASLDTIAVADRMVGPDERVVAETIVHAGGGPAATAAVTIARWGVPVELAAVVGDDEAGRTVLDGLEAEGVGVRHVERRRGATTAQSVAIVSRSTATRALLTRPGPPLHELPAGYDWAHCDQAGYPAVRAGRSRVRRLSLDDGNAVAGFVPADVDLYVPTAEVLLRRFGPAEGDDLPALVAAAKAATAAGAGAVVATRGGEGAVALDPAEDGEIVVPAADVPVESTLGAGDVFHGALLAALALGHGLLDAVRLAVVCAGLSCRGLDGRSAIPGLEETLQHTDLQHTALTSGMTTPTSRYSPATQKGRP